MTVAPVLPVSLSPHICVLPSQDLAQLLSSCSLPPLQHILQAFAPLSQVTTRSTELSSVIHPSFPLRFSDLHDIEAACKEHEDVRAGRTIDWIGQRITKRAAAWVEDVDSGGQEGAKDATTPWWKELQRCTEGDRTPSRSEGWNHPVAVILAMSTLAANPFQAVNELHARHDSLPPWVDPARMCHTLIIHPANSPLNGDEANALLNATTKQYGLRTHLLSLSLAHPAAPITVPPRLPELPPTPLPDVTFPKAFPEDAHHLHLTESDAAQLARFVREFTTMSLIPWMERCVLDWNEAFSSTRRLPSRLFSSTRRLFGGASGPTTHVAASPVQNQNTTAFANTAPSPTSSTFSGAPPQQRRLAEFATFLGDLKLAVSVWEALRKEGRGGSEVLPLLLAASPAVGTHATAALAALQNSKPTPSSQLRALVYAVRWATGVRALESLGGERWLDMAAGVSEEPPPALLLAHAARISARRGARRRAAMWYVFAAHRLEKCGIKSLTMHFFRKAHELYQIKPQKSLSPSFEDGVGLRKYTGGFDAILPSIEYSLGRLLYTSGDTEGALRYFLGLLKGSSLLGQQEEDLAIETDALYVGDFKVAFEHLRSTVGPDAFPVDLQPPFAFCNVADTKVRLPRQGELDVDDARWAALEEAWTTFWKPRGPERLGKGGKAVVGEQIWVDLMLRNPLDVEVNLANLTVKVETGGADANVEIEVIDNVFLRSKESRVVPVAIVAHDAASLKITHLTYLFLSLLPVSELLTLRGPRLHNTAAQRQGVVYGPDVVFAVEVEEGSRRVDLSLTQAVGADVSPPTPPPPTLAVGECVELSLGVRNTGRGAIDDVWIVHSPHVWLDLRSKGDVAERSLDGPVQTTRVVRSDNSLANARPTAIPLEALHGSPVLASNESLDLRLVFRAEQQGTEELAVLLLFREAGQTCFYSSRLHQVFVVTPLLEVGVSVRPGARSEVSYVINLEAENVSDTYDLRIAQVMTVSANWSCVAMDSQLSGGLLTLPPLQTGRIFLEAKHWDQGSGPTKTTEFVERQLGAVLAGREVEPLEPPALDLLFCNVVEATEVISYACSPSHLSVLESSRRSFTRGQICHHFRQLSPSLLPHIFPLRNPQAVDVVVGWEIPSERRRGCVTVPGLFLGACHAPLDELLQQAEAAKVKRTMYAETARERREILETIRTSEWNAEMDPTVVRVVPRPARVEHDFSQGECIVPVIFTIRNFSLTNHTRFALRLHADDSVQPSDPQHLPPSYVGALTRRGTLAPLASIEIKTEMWITRPGIYSLGGWRLETEVGGMSLDDSWTTQGSFGQGPPPGDGAIVIVSQQPS